jgi:hypothetical protein
MGNGTRYAMALLLAFGATGCDDADEPNESGSLAAGAKGAMSPMPPSGFAVEWGIPGVPSTVKPGASFGVGVPVKNIGDQAWPDPGHADPKVYASGAVRLTYRWWSADGSKTVTDYANAARGELVQPVQPSDSAVLAVLAVAPVEPGNYQLQLELVQENVSWFEEMGAARLMVPVTVVASDR